MVAATVIAIAFSPFELPLQAATFQPEGLNTLHSCLRDAAPDAWGRRVVGYRFPDFMLGELDYLLLLWGRAVFSPYCFEGVGLIFPKP